MNITFILLYKLTILSLIFFTVVTCPNPPLVANAGTPVGPVPSHYGDTLNYTCNNGYYRSVGDAVITCQADSTWRGSRPACSSKLYVVISFIINICEEQ